MKPVLPILCLLLTGCVTVPASEDNTARWLAHPEFKPAAKAAPHLMADILETTTRLEAELQLAKSK